MILRIDLEPHLGRSALFGDVVQETNQFTAITATSHRRIKRDPKTRNCVAVVPAAQHAVTNCLVALNHDTVEVLAGIIGASSCLVVSQWVRMKELFIATFA